MVPFGHVCVWERESGGSGIQTCVLWYNVKKGRGERRKKGRKKIDYTQYSNKLISNLSPVQGDMTREAGEIKRVYQIPLGDRFRFPLLHWYLGSTTSHRYRLSASPLAHTVPLLPPLLSFPIKIITEPYLVSTHAQSKRVETNSLWPKLWQVRYRTTRYIFPSFTPIDNPNTQFFLWNLNNWLHLIISFSLRNSRKCWLPCPVSLFFFFSHTHPMVLNSNEMISLYSVFLAEALLSR